MIKDLIKDLVLPLCRSIDNGNRDSVSIEASLLNIASCFKDIAIQVKNSNGDIQRLNEYLTKIFKEMLSLIKIKLSTILDFSIEELMLEVL